MPLRTREPGGVDGTFVTVLFTDIVGSTSLYDRRGDEAANALRREHFAALRAAVAEHGGREVKSTGDGLMVAFASAVAAVRCAADMQRATTGAPRGLALRVGLDAGEPLAEDEDLYGTAVNVAARLCQAAGGGQILASDVVRHIAGPRVAELMRPGGTRRLRGIARPIAVAEVRWDVAPVTGARPPEAPVGEAEVDLPAVAEPPSSAFVGRERELAELLAGLDDALAGRGGLFLLVGEPGIGKSRLADELLAHARARGARVLVGRCWEAGGAPAYWPWVQSLRGYVRESEPAELRAEVGAGAVDLAQIVPDLRRIFGDLPSPPPLASDAARFRLFDATAEFLRNASQRRPIVLVLDDLHAGDAPSLLLLQFLAREIACHRILVVGAYRDVDPVPGGPLREMLAEVAREPVTRRLALGGLNERELGEYVELTAPQLATEDLVSALHEETEGNPLFAAESLHLLAVEGAGSASGLVIPESVRDVIARRLAHLSPQCQQLLLLASVLGREFALDALEPMGGVAEDELLDLLDEAMVARVVAEVPGGHGRLRFAHVLIRDTLYDGLTGARRVRLHRQAVEALETLYGSEPGPHLAELAHHALAGNDADKGVDYARRAADRALTLLAYEEAARLYEVALEALPSGERARCELLLLLGEAQASAGDSPAAKEAFLRAADLARRLDMPRELARAAVGYGGRIVFARPGDDDRLVPLLEEALAALPEEEVELRARLLARLSGALRDEPSRDRRDRLSAEAVELARRTGNPAALAYAVDGRVSAIIAPDTIEACRAMATELCDVARRIGDLERLISAYSHRLVVQLQVGDVRGAEADLARSTRIAEELGQPARLWQVRGEEALLAIASGRLEEADELVAQALAFGERAQRREAMPVYVLQRAALAELRGTLDEHGTAIRDLAAHYPGRPVFRCALAFLEARLGRLAEAGKAFGEFARDGFAPLPFDQEWLFGAGLLAETCALLDDAEAAGVLYELIAPWAGLNAVDVGEGTRGSVARHLGLLATTTGCWEVAERHFEAALAKNAAMGARPWLALTQGDFARMLLARDGPGDRERARELSDAALATCRALGMASP